jgi:hypothetical protein
MLGGAKADSATTPWLLVLQMTADGKGIIANDPVTDDLLVIGVVIPCWPGNAKNRAFFDLKPLIKSRAAARFALPAAVPQSVVGLDLQEWRQ